MADHNIRVVTLLTGGEYLALEFMSDSVGLSVSAFIRRLLKLEAERRALAQVSEERRLAASAEPAQVLHTGGK